tara:strand:- start:6778 stop:7497 length:720 start_codon:yes stop_codon:yes gene_type:complete
MPKILKMKDKSDNFTIDKGMLFNCPFRLVIIGRTGCGKTSAIGSLLLLKEFYKDDIKGKDTYIFSPMTNDFKMEEIIKQKQVEEINVYNFLDDEILNALYEKLTEEFKEAVASKKKPSQKLILLDDLSFSGDLRSGFYNSVSRIFCNGRKHNINIIITSQYISHILPSCLSQISGGIFYNMSDRQLDILADHYNYTDNKKTFKKLFRDEVREGHDHFIINFSNSRSQGLYLNKNFEKIG